MGFTFGGYDWGDPPVKSVYDGGRVTAAEGATKWGAVDARIYREHDQPPYILPPAQHPGLVDVDRTEPEPVNVIPYTRVLMQRIELLQEKADWLMAAYKRAEKRNAELERVLRAARVSHADCDDTFYACNALYPESAKDRGEDTGCSCGADEHNARIDAALDCKD